MKIYIVIVLFLLSVVSGCTKEEAGVSNISTDNYENFAYEFTVALTNREYKKAYSMTSKEFKTKTTIEEMKASFEHVVPNDWGAMGPIELGETMTDWPDKRATDLGWVYVSIGGDVYSEAIIAIVSIEDKAIKIREVEYGRP